MQKKQKLLFQLSCKGERELVNGRGGENDLSDHGKNTGEKKKYPCNAQL